MQRPLCMHHFSVHLGRNQVARCRVIWWGYTLGQVYGYCFFCKPWKKHKKRQTTVKETTHTEDTLNSEVQSNCPCSNLYSLVCWVNSYWLRAHDNTQSVGTIRYHSALNRLLHKFYLRKIVQKQIIILMGQLRKNDDKENIWGRWGGTSSWSATLPTWNKGWLE